MDLPLKLEKEELVQGLEQVKQELIMLLSSENGEFLQDYQLGVPGIIHTSLSAVAIDAYITSACSKLKGVEFLYANKISKSVDGEEVACIEAFISYNGKTLKMEMTDKGWQ